MTAPQPPDRKHLVADALHRLADLVAAGRVEEYCGILRVRATDESVVEDLVAAMDAGTVQEPTLDSPSWAGRLHGQPVFVWVEADVPTLAQVASAAPTPDAMQPTDPAWWDVDQPRVWRWETEADRVEPEGVTEVIDEDLDTWDRLDREWHCADEGRGFADQPWPELLKVWGPLREVVPGGES